MRVVICGAGQVGFGIAERLASEQNDVTVIDLAADLIKSITDKLDVRGIVGHGAHPDVLRRAGAEECDMIIAVTLFDEVNMVACQVAHSLFAIPTKIARIRAQTYLEPVWRDLFSREHLPIDVVISPEIEVGEVVLRALAYPGAFEVTYFANRKIAFIGVHCGEDCPIIDTPLRQLSELFPDLRATIVAIERGGKLLVPSGSDQLLSGDDVYFVAERGHVERTLSAFGHDEKQARRIIIAGGGNIGSYVARQLEIHQKKARIKIIENNREQAMKAADSLDNTVVLNGDALDKELLLEAGVASSDTLIALTNDDKVNILAAVMAKKAGCSRSVSLLSNRSFDSILTSLGIDAFIDPRATTVSKILRHVRRGRIRGVYSVRNGAGEVIEAEALDTSPMVGKPLRDAELPKGIRIGVILRKDDIIIPQGNTVIQSHDRVIILAEREQVHQVEQMFRVSLEFF